MRTTTQLLLAMMLFAVAAAPLRAHVVTRQDRFGDAMQLVLPATAAAVALSHDDSEGLKQLAFSAGLSQGSTELIKYAANSPRPDGGGRGFPSGHASIAFVSASYVHFRYGLGTAVPLYALAGLTAANRVATHHHFTKDVIAGALVGSGSALLITHRFGDAASAVLVPVDGGAWLYFVSQW